MAKKLGSKCKCIKANDYGDDYMEPYMQMIFEPDEATRSATSITSLIYEQCEKGIEMPWNRIALLEPGTYKLKPVPPKKPVSISVFKPLYFVTCVNSNFENFGPKKIIFLKHFTFCLQIFVL